MNEVRFKVPNGWEAESLIIRNIKDKGLRVISVRRKEKKNEKK
jgi:hypothetical protein